MSIPARLMALFMSASATLLLVAAPATAAPGDAELAARWAPIHHQDTDSSDYDADYLTAVDFDGEWNTQNNWDNQDDDNSRLRGTVYYSVVETETHWQITYSFYHPRDWEDVPDPFGLLTHENDMEGVLLTVRKDGSTYGKAEAMVSVAHTDFYSYVPSGSTYTGGRENIDGTLLFQTYNGVPHPVTRQEAKGHGVYAWDGASNFPGGDGVIYYPSGTAEVPSDGNDRSVGYQLVDAFAASGLWARRADATTYASYGTFRGDNGKDNAANTAWGWDDGNDLPRGMLAHDPAYLVSVYFANRGSYSLTYTRNNYGPRPTVATVPEAMTK